MGELEQGGQAGVFAAVDLVDDEGDEVLARADQLGKLGLAGRGRRIGAGLETAAVIAEDRGIERVGLGEAAAGARKVADRAPDSRTVWFFRETLAETGALERLFHAYRDRLLSAGLITREGSLVDASFVTVPKRRNTREENERLKQGEVPPAWTPEQRAHKDR